MLNIPVIIISSAITALAFLYISHSNFETDKSSNNQHDLTITSHRGYAGKYPENTLIAIKKGLETKADRIEIDVQQTKDNVVVVMHDNSIDRTTNGQGDVKNFNYEELKQFSAGQKFDSVFVTQRIPTLEEVLKLMNGQSNLIIEIKSGNEYYPNIESNIIHLINKYKAQDWSIIHAFDDDILEAVHKIDSTIPLHKVLLSPYFYDFDQLDYVEEYSIYHRFVSEKLIRRIHQMGKKINAWTVNDESKMKKLINLGIDGIITDFPEVAIQCKE